MNMMRIEFTVWRSWSDDEQERSIEALIELIKTFCRSGTNCAIWDNFKTEDVTYCASFLFNGDDPGIVKIFNQDQISKAVREWCYDLCDYLYDIIDDSEECAQRTVEIEDNSTATGFIIKTYDGDDLEECFHVVPAEDMTNDYLNAGRRPGVVSRASTSPAGGARHSASNLEGAPRARKVVAE